MTSEADLTPKTLIMKELMQNLHLKSRQSSYVISSLISQPTWRVPETDQKKS